MSCFMCKVNLQINIFSSFFKDKNIFESSAQFTMYSTLLCVKLKHETFTISTTMLSFNMGKGENKK